MPTHKSIKALCRKLIDGDIYHASRLITLERHLEHELMPLLSTSGKKDIYIAAERRRPPISIGG